MPSATPEILDTSNIYSSVSLASRWLFVFFALMLLFFAFAWHWSDRRERRKRFKNLPGAGTVGELVVLSGGDELPVGTWFPVPREGVLGSVRSCDLVVPCDGVHSQHLDFSWQDGTGLLVRPRLGCEVMVDGTPVSRRGAYADAPLAHGSVLQIGSAVLRLQLFAALSHTNRPYEPQVPAPGTVQESWMPPAQPPVQDPYAASQPWPGAPDRGYFIPQSQMPAANPVPPEISLPDQSPDSLPQQSDQSGESNPPVQQRRKRAERWKEDWSE